MARLLLQGWGKVRQGESQQQAQGGPRLRRPAGAGPVLKENGGGGLLQAVSRAPGSSLPSDPISSGTLAQAAPSAHLPHEWGSTKASPQPRASVFTFLLDVSAWMPAPQPLPASHLCPRAGRWGDSSSRHRWAGATCDGPGELSRTRQQAWDSRSGGWTVYLGSPME